MKDHKLQLHPAQAAFRGSKAPFRGFVGGRGAGKSFVGALDMLIRAHAKKGLYLVAAPTYPMLRDASLRSFKDLGRKLGLLENLNRSNLTATLTNGSEVIFRSADEPDRLRGPNLSGAWLDEASLMLEEAYSIVIACLREEGQQGWLSATFTPRGKQHWTYNVFGEGGPNVELFHARTTDNPFLPKTFAATIRGQYTEALALQELEGEFTDAEGVLFRRAWFPIVAAAPASMALMRSWDLASSEPRKGADPDWTAGVLLGRCRDLYYVLDVQRLRASPGNVEDAIKQTADLDGRKVPIWIEQEPGSAGATVISHYVRALAGWTVRGERSTGAKAIRAQPLASQAEAGNVRLLKADWNRAFLDEVEMFPLGRHDDQVDALSLAFAKLTAKPMGTGRGPSAVNGIGRGPRVTSTPGVAEAAFGQALMETLRTGSVPSIVPERSPSHASPNWKEFFR